MPNPEASRQVDRAQPIYCAGKMPKSIASQGVAFYRMGQCILLITGFLSSDGQYRLHIGIPRFSFHCFAQPCKLMGIISSQITYSRYIMTTVCLRSRCHVISWQSTLAAARRSPLWDLQPLTYNSPNHGVCSSM